MQVFNVSMKVLKRNAPSILIYLGIFLGLSLLFASNSSEQEAEYASFETVKTPVALFLEEDTPLTRSFEAYLKENAYLVTVKDEEKTLADALYFRIITYVIRIPEGFTDSFLNGEPLPIVKETLPDAITNIYTDLSIENFFNTARVYRESLPDASLSDVLEKTKATLSLKTPVQVETYGGEKPSSYTRFYYNYMSYSMVSILVLGTSIIMLLWRDLPLRRRTEVSPLRKSSIQLQKVLSLGVFTLLTFVLLNVFYFLVNRNAVLDDKTLLHIGNSFILAFTSMGMSFLVGTLLKSRNAITAVSNVVSLGPSFISGVFVPQALLGEGVLTLARVTPTYYYVTANELIATLGNTMNEKIYTNMLILFAFGIAFFLLAFYFGQRRKTKVSD